MSPGIQEEQPARSSYRQREKTLGHHRFDPLVAALLNCSCTGGKPMPAAAEVPRCFE